MGPSAAVHPGNVPGPHFASRRPATSARPARRLASFPWLGLCLGSGAVGAVLVYAAQQHESPVAYLTIPAARPAVVSAAPPLWTPIARPLPIYGMEAPGLKGLPFAFSARRAAEGVREDTLTFGAFDQDGGPHLRMLLHRAADPQREPPSLFLDLARRASDTAGLAVIRSTPAEGLATKFGAMETSEATLSDALERTCLGFRFAHREVGFRLLGWLCPAKGQALDRQELACTLDRLSLLESGNDEALKTLFAQADRQRIDGCTPAPISRVEPRKNGRSASRPSRRAGTALTGRRKDSAARLQQPARRAGNAASNSRG
jgi:hypothetical protein